MIIVLAYHSISKSDYMYSVDTNEFRAQLTYLKSKFDIISVCELENIIASGVMSLRNKAVITFDDGLEDNYTNAFPVLKEVNIPATIFISTKFINGSIKNTHGYEFKFLNPHQIKEMEASGLIRFQNHTHSHPVLTTISKKEIEKENNISKKILKEHLHNSVEFIAYPKGKYSDEVISVMKESFKLGFGSEGVIESLERVSKMEVPRFVVRREPWWKFRVKLLPQFWKLKKIMNK